MIKWELTRLNKLPRATPQLWRGFAVLSNAKPVFVVYSMLLCHWGWILSTLSFMFPAKLLSSSMSTSSSSHLAGSFLQTHHLPSHRRRGGWRQLHRSSGWEGWYRTCRLWSPGYSAGSAPSCCPWSRARLSGPARRTSPSSVQPGLSEKPALSNQSPHLKWKAKGRQWNMVSISTITMPFRSNKGLAEVL